MDDGKDMNGARDRKIIDHQDEPSSGAPLRQEQASYGEYTTANVVKELMTTEKWPRHPNLRRRPHSPNKGKGRLQRQIARAFAVGGPVLSSSQVYDWAFAGKRKLSQLRRHGVWRILMARCLWTIGPQFFGRHSEKDRALRQSRDCR
jgi:hypothetical protein